MSVSAKPATSPAAQSQGTRSHPATGRGARAAAALVLLLAAAPPAAAQADPPAQDADALRPLLRVLGYLPSRALDLLDTLRLRGRVGPGTAVSLRASESADLFFGSYTSLYAGLPGPRGGRLPRLPAGMETRSGAELGAADLSSGVGFGPRYSTTEVGAGFQLFMIGADIGIDPVELADWVVGFAGIDLRGDDWGS
jgi:hypothetical protein